MRPGKRTGYLFPVFFVALFSSAPGAFATPAFTAPVPVNLFDPQGTDVGAAIAIAGDTLAVAGQSGGDAAVYIYARVNGVWVETARLSSPAAQAGTTTLLRFGTSLAISSDGNTVFVGDPLAACASDASLPCGAIDIYKMPAAGWADTSTPASRLTPSVTASEEIGTALSISSDGTTLVAYGDAVYVFTQPGGGWVSATQTAVLGSASGIGNNGTAFSGVSVDGDTIAVNTEAGSVVVYSKPGSGWQDTTAATATLTDSGLSDTILGDFGSSLKVAGDIILVGAPGANTALLYQEPGSGGWVSTTFPTAALQTPTNPFNFGDGINMVGTTAVVGSLSNLYLYDEPNSGWSSEAATATIAPTNTLNGTLLIGRHSIYVTGSELATTSADQCDGGSPALCIADYVLSSTAASTNYDGMMLLGGDIDDVTSQTENVKSGLTGDQLNFNFTVDNMHAPATGSATFEATASGGTLTAVSSDSGGSCNLSGGKAICELKLAPDQSAAVVITEQTAANASSATVNASLSAISPLTWNELAGTLVGSLPLTIAPFVPLQSSFSGNLGQTIKRQDLPVRYAGKNTLTFTVVQQPDGVLTVDPNTGAFTWVPPSSFNGITDFTYHVSDGAHTSIESNVTITEGTGSGKGSGGGGGGVLGIPMLALLWGGLLLRRRKALLKRKL